MTKDGRWTSGSMGFCMKEDCIARGPACKDCYGINPPSNYKTSEQLELPFGGKDE